jgi:hypothetical protein
LKFLFAMPKYTRRFRFIPTNQHFFEFSCKLNGDVLKKIFTLGWRNKATVLRLLKYGEGDARGEEDDEYEEEVMEEGKAEVKDKLWPLKNTRSHFTSPRIRVHSIV